jgi:hypothetical protein
MPVLALLLAACTDAHSPQRPSAQAVFDAVAPSVVAILNDDRSDREAEIAELEKKMGQDARSPKHVVDVSLRKDPTPQGTGFMIAGGLVVTAAHVVLRPDRLKITTRAGKTVAAELVHLDEARDVAVLRPKEPLTDVPPLDLEEHDLAVGEPVWALGHTGRGLWALSWGMSEGIASGIVDMFGEKLLLFDASVYPGFSGGPVVTFHNHGRAEVAGVNHAILYTGMSETPMAPIFSAVAVSELREVLAGTPPSIEKPLAAYAAQQRLRTYADLFLTDKLQVTKDENGQQVAHIFGDTKAVKGTEGEVTRVPCVAMIFGAAPGTPTVGFELRDPTGTIVGSSSVKASVDLKQRVTFVSSAISFAPKTRGKHALVVSLDGKDVGKAWLTVETAADGEEATHDHDTDALEDGEPDVDVVVAQLAQEDPLALLGIRSGWAEKSYPRRVGFTYFARASRGWSGTDVSVSAWVLDDAGKIVGRSDGCFFPEVRPEHTWQCMNQGGGLGSPPLAAKTGSYDVVFTINSRPVAWWPMEAVLRKDAPDNSMEKWLDEMKHVQVPRP